jgi:beta-lactamase class A
VYGAILFVFILTIKSFFFNNTRVISPIPDSIEKKSSLLRFFKKEKDPSVLKDRIKKTVNNEWTNYSVLVKDLNSSFTAGINDSLIYNAASVNKVPILAAIYDKAKRGEIDFDRIVTVQQDDVQDYGTGKIRYDPPGTTYSVKTLIQLMTQKSDNTAAFILGNYIVTLDGVQSYVNAIGMTQTDIIDNKTSNKDMAILFEKMYKKQVTTPALSEELMGLLSDSDFEDRLPALLPKDSITYHKIGTGTGAVHDVGVVVHGSTAYYVGIFTSDVTDEEQAASLMAKVSKTIYDFMYEK